MYSKSNNLFIGKVLIELESIDSTNRFAASYLANNKPIEGTTIIAYNQSKGKGQFGNSWESESGKNITISIILYPKFLKPTAHFLLNQVCSLAIRDLVSELTGEEAKVKWPNDIYLNDKKIGGILIENSIIKDRIESTIVGIGLNVNQTRFSRDVPNAISLKLASGENFVLSKVRQQLFSNLERYYLLLKDNQLESVRSKYLEHLRGLNVAHRFSRKNQELDGVIKGVDPLGRLMVGFDGSVEAFNFKEIEMLN